VGYAQNTQKTVQFHGRYLGTFDESGRLYKQHATGTATMLGSGTLDEADKASDMTGASCHAIEGLGTLSGKGGKVKFSYMFEGCSGQGFYIVYGGSGRYAHAGGRGTYSTSAGSPVDTFTGTLTLR
jgi:hypothetical protein